MLQVSCDLCGRRICRGEEQHFILKMEIYAADDPSEITEDDLDNDHMETLSEILCQAVDLDEAEQLLPTTQQRRYDLCSNCRAKFLNDPLGQESAQNLDFSEN